MNGGIIESVEDAAPSQNFDYHYITTPARIAIYDSLKTAPRVIQVQGGPTHEYIEHIASLTYKNAKEAGGMIPYTVIREVSENFIHANFNEVVVSIFDQGNTIRFADQGPGIKHKDLVQEPGFSSAIEPMKRYIRGVGSGLPIVKDYLSTSHGHIEIKDNVNQGSVVTISLVASRTTDEEIEAAAKAVHAHEFIMELPDGYDTVVEERGSTLSAGQRQLIAFARVLLADPRILILDEATSNIDTRTEEALQAGLQHLLKGRTSFIIAHRLSTIENADEIFYIDHGQIVEHGSHAQLLAAKGAYYRLYESQYAMIRVASGAPEE